MRRYAFGFVAAVSMLLCAATVVLWVRSNYVADTVSLVIDDKPDISMTTLDLTSVEGLASVSLSWHAAFGTHGIPNRNERPTHRILKRGDYLIVNATCWERAGFKFHRHSSGHMTPPKQVGAVSGVRLPYWFIVATLVLLPIKAFIGFCARNGRFRHGHCPTCGYSLTGNTSGTCPECGTRVSQKVEGTT